jgi:V/A-type H+-transporting ATPase subunit C
MRSLARYATTNAVTRTMLSELLTAADLESIARSESVQSAWLALRKTPYERWVPEDPPGEVLAIERILREVTAARFRRSAHTLRGKPRQVSTALLARWDLDNLEFALRLWHSKDTSLQDYLTFPSFVNDIPIYDVVEAETLEEIALILRHTPYFEPVSSSVRMYREKNSIFFVEIVLERDYYERLLSVIRELGGKDAAQAQRIVSAEIDLVNLSWLARLVEYYEVEPASFQAYMIPAPSEISRRLAEPGVTTERLKDLRSRLVGERSAEGAEGTSHLDTIAMIEGMVSEAAVDTARSALAGYPFSIACVFAFYLLKRTELKNLNTVFGGKEIGVPDNEILSRLYGLR